MQYLKLEDLRKLGPGDTLCPHRQISDLDTVGELSKEQRIFEDAELLDKVASAFAEELRLWTTNDEWLDADSIYVSMAVLNQMGFWEFITVDTFIEKYGDRFLSGPLYSKEIEAVFRS